MLNRKAVREHKSESGQTLSRYAGADSPLKLQITASEPAEPIELPAGAVNLLMQILEAIAAARGAAVIPENTELTTLQAAEVLSVSRPFLIKLLEEKKIPHRKAPNSTLQFSLLVATAAELEPFSDLI